MAAARTDPADDPYPREEVRGAGSARLIFVVVGVLVGVGLVSLLALYLRPGAPEGPEPTPREEARQGPAASLASPAAETQEEARSAPPVSVPSAPDEAFFQRFAEALPTDAQMHFDVKLGAARRAPVWKALAERIPPETLSEIRDRLADLARARFNDADALSRRAAQVPREFLDNITRVTGAVAAEGEDFIIGLATRDSIDWRDAADVMRTFSSREGATIHDINVSGLPAWAAGDDDGPDPGAFALARYRDDFAIVGTIPAIEEALAAMSEKAGNDVESFAARARAAEPYSALVITRVTSPIGELTLPQSSEDGAVNPLLSAPLPVSSLEGGRVTLEFSDTIGLTSANEFGDSQQAVQFKGMLDGMLALVSMMTAQQPDLAQMMAGITTGIDGNTITVRLEITPDQIAAICGLVLAQAPATQPARSDDTKTCEGNLRAIYAALVMHTIAHDGAYPASLAELTDSLPDPRCLRSPLAGPGDDTGATSYILRADLRGSVLAGDSDPAREPIVWLDPAVARGSAVTVLYADGHVQRVPFTAGADPVSTFRSAARQVPSSRPNE